MTSAAKPDSDLLPFTLDFVQAAGALALDIQATAAQQLKADKSLVTEADLAISQLFKNRLAERSDAVQHFVIDEEDSGSVGASAAARTNARYVWTLDPIDGTMPYANQMPFWGILISVFDYGQPACAAIYLPALGDLIYADDKQAYHQKNGAHSLPLSARPLGAAALDRPIFIDTVMMTSAMTRFTGEAKFFDVHSAAINIAFVLLGRASAAFLNPRMSVWDIAPAIVIGKAMGLPIIIPKTLQPITKLDESHYKDSWKLADYLLLTHPGCAADLAAALLPQTNLTPTSQTAAGDMIIKNA